MNESAMWLRVLDIRNPCKTTRGMSKTGITGGGGAVVTYSTVLRWQFQPRVNDQLLTHWGTSSAKLQTQTSSRLVQTTVCYCLFLARFAKVINNLKQAKKITNEYPKSRRFSNFMKRLLENRIMQEKREVIWYSRSIDCIRNRNFLNYLT